MLANASSIDDDLPQSQLLDNFTGFTAEVSKCYVNNSGVIFTRTEMLCSHLFSVANPFSHGPVWR
jgi:hypothetical protein